MNSVFKYLWVILLTGFLSCSQQSGEERIIEAETKTEGKTDTTTDTDTESVFYTAVSVRGNAAWSPDDTRWEMLAMNARLEHGWYVETGVGSYATLNGSLGDAVMMGEKAKVRLSLEELRKCGRRSCLALRGVEMLRGLARFDVRRQGGDFLVETPTATVKVKGTVFTVNVDSTGNTDVAVVEGVVEVIDRRDTTSSYEIAAGRVVRKAGTAQSELDTCRPGDTLLYTGEFINHVGDRAKQTERAKLDDQAEKELLPGNSQHDEIDEANIRENLTPAPGYHSVTTAGEGARVARRIDEERKRVGEEIEEQKSEFHDKKTQIEESHNTYKAAEQKKVTRERDEAHSTIKEEIHQSNETLQKTRSSFYSRTQKERLHQNAEIEKTRKRSNDAFEELQKRKGR